MPHESAVPVFGRLNNPGVLVSLEFPFFPAARMDLLCCYGISPYERRVEDMSVVELIKERNIHLEICITSNFKTDVFPVLANHTINQLKELGVSFGINTAGGT